MTLNLMIGSQNPFVRTFICLRVWSTPNLRSRGFDLRKPLLHQGHVPWLTFWRFFRIFEICRFDAIFRVFDRGDYSHQLFGAFERLGGSSGAQSTPDFLTFLVRIVVGCFCRCSCFRISRVRGLISTRISGGMIHATQMAPLTARVPYLEPDRGQISRHFCSAWWSSFLSIFGFSNFLGWGYIVADTV